MESFFDFVLNHRREILEQTTEHLWITSVALVIATLVGVTAGILLTRYRTLSRPVLGFVNIIQTVPSIALLGFLLPLFGIGVTPAIIALFLYALLPIVRNTYAGIESVDAAVVEAARGLGMSNRQILQQVELPLAIPVIFAGVRTALVINIGVATLCALIAAGGLGEYIFRGIAVNNVNMVLAGAVPASLLAIVLDTLLSILQQHIREWIRPVAIVFAAGCFALLGYVIVQSLPTKKGDALVAGFNPEFMEREDGYPGLQKVYGFSLPTQEMEIGLMYDALNNHHVDVISGFSTDGRIQAYNLRVLEDDQQYFPPYYAAPIIRQQTLNRYPQLKTIFSKLADQILAADIMAMNYAVDSEKQAPRTVARRFLQEQDFTVVPKKTGTPDIVVGSKNFTENFILAELFAALIEGNTDLTVELRQGFGGTKLLMDALKVGAVDLYPEYTGTVLLVMLKPEKAVIDSLIQDKDQLYTYVQQASERRFNLTFLPPLGFNNTTALMMREKQAEQLNLKSISDLGMYMNRTGE